MSILKVNTIQDKGGNNLLVSDGAGTISSGGLMTNTPAFYADLSADQSTSSGVTTKASINNVIIDTHNCYDNSSNYRFTPTVAGKYFVYASLRSNGNLNSKRQYFLTHIYKNGSEITQQSIDFRGNFGGLVNSVFSSAIVEMNGSSDYLEVYGTDAFESGSTGGFDGSSSHSRSFFGAYRIIGA